MLSTTHTELDPTSVRDVLRTYDTHHTGTPEPSAAEEEQQQQTSTPESATTQSADENPQNWPSDWHRTPPYRAASRTHRVADRAAGVDNVEGAMVVFMFTGVFIQGVS